MHYVREGRAAITHCIAATCHALCDNPAKAGITTAATMHGFSHLSHFTDQYQRRNGELPSTTLRALRENSLPQSSPAIRESVNLIVLPFICTDPEPSYTTFAEMLTDQIISALSRTRWLNVLSPDSSLPITRNMLPCAQYAVRGRVQCVGGHVQAIIRLIDVTTSRQIWGNAFDGATDSVMELQQRVTDAVASALPACLQNAEAARGKPKVERNPAVVRGAMQAFHAILEMTQSANERALEHLDRAQSIDPEFPFARALAAWCHAQRAACCFGDTIEIDRELQESLSVGSVRTYANWWP